MNPSPPARLSSLAALLRGRPAGYWFAVGVSAGTILLRYLLSEWFGDRLALTVFFLPILLCAYVGGLGPGLLATGVTASAALVMFIPSVFALRIERAADAVQWVFYIVAGVVTTVLVESLHRARLTLQEARAQQESHLSKRAAEMEERLRIEAQLSRLTAMLPGAFYTLEIGPDGRGAFTYLSAGWENLTGLSVEAVRTDARAAFAAIHPDDLGAYQAAEAQARQRLGLFAAEFRVRHPRKGWVWIEARSLPAVLPGGVYQWHGYSADITERKRAEAAVRENAERMRLASEAAHIGVWETDLRSGRLTWSAEQERMMGYAPGSFSGRMNDFLALIHPDDLESHRQARERAFAGDGFYATEVRFRRIDGRIRWGLLRGQLWRDEQGRPERLLGIDIDITEQKEADQALAESRRQLQLFIAHAPAALAMFDRELRYVSVSRRWAEDYGLTEADLIGRCHYEVFPGISEAWKAVHRRALAGDVVCAEADRFERADGRVQWLRWEVRPWYANGPEVSGILIFSEDITERIRATAALRESEQRFATAFRASPAGVAINRRSDQANIEVNESFLRLFEFSREEILGRSTLAAGIIDEVTAQWISRQLNLVGSVRNAEITTRTRTGKSRQIVLSVQVMELGGEACALSTLVDVTDRAQAQAQLAQLNEELEQRVAHRTAELETANRQLEAFSYTVSHDLRAPLRAIDGFAAVLAEDLAGQLPPASERHLETIRSETRRMGQLIDDLLAFSRLSRAHLHLRTVDMQAMAGQVLAELVSRETGRTIEPRVGRLPPCAGDAALLKQVWINLISNALKYTRKCPVARIEIEAREEAGEITYLVRDNGTGFDMRYAAKLFGVFQRLHRAEDYEGTGVGLAIVQQVVQRHGGRVHAQGAVDAGATFQFVLPRALPA